MARPGRNTKDTILAKAYGLFYKEGFARVSMDAIAGAAGVTKRTLYYHFESKDALAAAVLDRQHVHTLARFISWSKQTYSTPEEVLADLFENLEVWARSPQWLGSGFTRLTMELADLPGHPARRAARQHKAAVEHWLAGELARVGANNPDELAQQVMLLVEGCLSLMLIHGEPGYAKTAAQAAHRLIEAQADHQVS
jgi:AcrR family transcriptional regulator